MKKLILNESINVSDDVLNGKKPVDEKTLRELAKTIKNMI